MEFEKIKIDLILLSCVVQSLGRMPETLYDLQKVKNLYLGGKPIRLIDPYNDSIPDRLEIVEGDFSAIGKMSRLKKLLISAMPIEDFSFLRTCISLEELEISGCGVIDCAILAEVTSIKRLSLHYCAGLEHMEKLLKLYRLKRLSLEGTMITDADCFRNCWIPEVYLPEHILKERRRAEKKEEQRKSEEKGQRKRKEKGEQQGTTEEQQEVQHGTAVSRNRTEAHLCAGVPFRAAERKAGTYSYTLTESNSPLWEVYRGAYGNVSEYIAILMDERERAPETFKLRRLETVPKTNYEIAFDNLFENLYHQMSFYQASWLVLPYLARLMEGWEKEEDKEWLFQGIMAAGSCLATDVFGDRPGEEDLYESYLDVAREIHDIAVRFLAQNIDFVLEKPIVWRREFAIAVMAVLGEKKLAYMFYLSGMESCYIVCPACENCDEEIEFGYFEPSERIKVAKAPSEKWDGESLRDVKLWLFNLFDLLEDDEGKERLCYYFGTYECPECGEEVPVLKGMEEYFG